MRVNVLCEVSARDKKLKVLCNQGRTSVVYLYTSPYVICSRDHIVKLSFLKLSFKSLAGNLRQHFIIHIFQGAS